jgi:hypothetical protein
MLSPKKLAGKWAILTNSAAFYDNIDNKFGY